MVSSRAVRSKDESKPGAHTASGRRQTGSQGALSPAGPGALAATLLNLHRRPPRDPRDTRRLSQLPSLSPEKHFRFEALVPGSHSQPYDQKHGRHQHHPSALPFTAVGGAGPHYVMDFYDARREV